MNEKPKQSVHRCNKNKLGFFTNRPEIIGALVGLQFKPVAVLAIARSLHPPHLHHGRQHNLAYGMAKQVCR